MKDCRFASSCLQIFFWLPPFNGKSVEYFSSIAKNWIPWCLHQDVWLANDVFRCDMTLCTSKTLSNVGCRCGFGGGQRLGTHGFCAACVPHHQINMPGKFPGFQEKKSWGVNFAGVANIAGPSMCKRNILRRYWREMLVQKELFSNKKTGSVFGERSARFRSRNRLSAEVSSPVSLCFDQGWLLLEIFLRWF